MPKTTDISIPSNLKGLFYGPSGSGKTYLLSTAPKPMYILDLDNGVQTIAGVPGIEYDVFDHTSLDLPSNADWKRHCTTLINNVKAKVRELINDCPYESVGFDSSTQYGDWLGYHLININNRWNQDPQLRIQDYGVIAEEMADIFLMLLQIDANVFITGHNRVVMDEEKGETLYLPLMTGQKFPQKVPMYFDEMYRLVVKVKPGANSNEYLLQTQSDNKWSAKTRLNYYDAKQKKIVPVLNKYEPANLTEMIEKVGKARKQSS